MIRLKKVFNIWVISFDEKDLNYASVSLIECINKFIEYINIDKEGKELAEKLYKRLNVEIS